MFIIITAAFLAAINVSHAAPLREQQFQLSIERGPLAFVLEQFSDQTGVHIGAEISVDHSRAPSFGPFIGDATVDEAMKELLAGTDLWYAWRAEDTIRLFLTSAQRTGWSSGVVTAKEASDSIHGLAGVRYETGMCGNLLVGPFHSDEPMTAEAFWVELIKPHCPVVPKRIDIQLGSFEHPTVAGHAEHTFALPEMPRILALRRISEQAGVVVKYLSSDAQEEQGIVGPISGSMSLNEALQRAMRHSVLRIRWMADDIVSVEPAYTVTMYADMSKCPCNFGLPETRLVESREVEVTDTRLPPFEEYSQAPVRKLDRRFIDSTGASTIPELLNYVAQQSFDRSRAHRANAAQYFEGRGFGAQYALVLIDGHRAYGSAGDPMTNAFDLNLVPLSAVERLEVALDQPSIRYGTDAIGGTVNIVLKRAFDKNAATLSLGSVEGGADRNRATLWADHEWQTTKVGFVFDYLARDHLLGSTRDRWRNQDFTRYPGGVDYRLPFGVPPNISSIADDSITPDLPGLGAPSAALAIGPSGLTFRPNETNWQSALAYAAIEPSHERSSLYGFAQTVLGGIELKFGLLWGNQTASLQFFPESVVDLPWGADHPQSPFDIDVNVSTLLTGLPPREQGAEARLQRYTIDLKGFFGRWEYSAFLATHEDKSRAWLANFVDPVVLAQSLTTDDPTGFLNILSARPGEGRVPKGLLLPLDVSTYETQATQFGGQLSGNLVAWRAVNVEADVGIERRLEGARFHAFVEGAERDITPNRDITSIFSRLRIPIVSVSGPSLLRQWEINLGARRDFYNNVRDVTTWQSSLSWQPHSGVDFHAAYTTLFRPPSLYELYLPPFSLPYVVLDPHRNEAVPVTWVSGGNSSLHPTEGDAVNVGFSIDDSPNWKASLNYWETRMRDRIFPVSILDLLNAPDDVAGRIARDTTTRRMLTLDTRQANFGAVKARGFDVSIQRAFETALGRITPGIDFTHTVDFQYRNLPGTSSPMLDRAGFASLYGTIPTQRAIVSVIFERDGLNAAVFLRHHGSYKDSTPYKDPDEDPSIVAGAATDRRIPAQTLLDLKITTEIGDHVTLSFGANNVLDDQPPFAPIGGWEGFDSSQGDLMGREVFFDITGSF